MSALVIVTDLVWGRIFNWLTAPAFMAGVALAFALGGWERGADSLLGGVAGLLLYGWIFRLGFLGGGDVKFLMALGAWGGLRFCAETALLSILVGGALAAVLLATKGRLISLLRRLFRFLQSVAIPQLELEPVRVDRSHTMPFGIPMAIAAVWNVFGQPLTFLGLGAGAGLWPMN